MGDPVLAKFMRKAWPKPPVENIVGTDFLATAINRDKLGHDMRKRIVVLECGHTAVTRNAKKSPCHQCHEMILAGEDYDAFRNGRNR